MFYFPKTSVGRVKEWSAMETASRQQEQSASEFADYAASIDGFLCSNAASSSSGDPDSSMFALMVNPSTTGSATLGGSGVDIPKLREKKTRLMASVGLA